MLALLDQPPPNSYAQWNGPLLAAALDGVSVHQVWRILRQHNICLERRRTCCFNTDPEFGSKAADEKPSIQALERAQGYLRLPDGKAFNGLSDYDKRHGRTTLFAALEVTTGLVKTGHSNRRRRREFLDFTNELVAGHANREIHVVLDNVNTHKPKNDRWLKKHLNVHLHFTLTYSSWLNQVECWFSIISRHTLRGGSFTSARQLRKAIDDFGAGLKYSY